MGTLVDAKVPTSPGGFAQLKQNMLVSIGDAHLFVTLNPMDAEQINQPYTSLALKYINGSKQSQANNDFTFHHTEMQDGQRDILIGRAPDCDITIDDKLLSKVQCHIKLIYNPFNSNQFEWVIFDGYK